MEKSFVSRKCIAKLLLWSLYAYMLLPVSLFIGGWIKIYFALPMLLVVVCSWWKSVHETEMELWIPEFTKDNAIKLLGISLMIFLWVYYSGIGAHVYQSSDHYWRNGIFEALVNQKWPVKNLNHTGSGSSVALVYYIGFWLLSAAVGKIFGLKAGYNFQMVWAFIGIWLTYCLVCSARKKIDMWPLLVLVFFSGLDAVGNYLVGIEVGSLSNDTHLEWWMPPYQYSSMTTQLFWVFNQAVPAWLCTIFMRQQKNNRSMVFILSTCLLSATFPFVGLLVLAVYWYLSHEFGLCECKDISTGKKLLRLWKSLLTVQNVLGGGVIGIVSFLYLMGNHSASGIAGNPSIFANISFARYFIFVLVEAGIYLALLYKYKKNHWEYYAVALSLVSIPLLMGTSRDFCMRVSIPALFVMALSIIDVLPKMRANRDWIHLFGLILALSIGAITPLHEVTRAVWKTVEFQNNGYDIAPVIPFEQLISESNFSGSTENNFFFEHLAG